MQQDKRLEIIDWLFEKAHRFLHEDEVVDALINANIDIADTNYIINSLLEKGVYISGSIHDAMSAHEKEIKRVSNECFSSRKIPVIPTTFKMLNIPIGSELLFLKDKNVVAITIDDINQIELKDKSLKGSLSSLAQILAVKYGYADTARQGPRWWTYNGKTLLSIREQLDNV